MALFNNERSFYSHTQASKVVAVLDAATANGLISQLERHALEQYCDPVHCHMLGRGAIPGFSKTNENGLASFNVFSTPITIPAGLVGGGNWDMAIEVFSNMNQQTVRLANRTANVLTTFVNANQFQTGGITANAALSSNGGVSWGTANTFPVTSFFSGGQFSLNGNAAPLNSCRGRPVAMAIKLEDATNTLNQSGVIHTCRLPVVDSAESSTYTSNIVGFTGSFQVKEQFASPIGPQGMAVMPGYMTHLVKDGFYSVIMIDQSQDAVNQDYTGQIFISDPSSETSTAWVCGPSAVGTTYRVLPVKNSGIVPQLFYLAGLPQAFSGTLTLYLVYDMKPHPNILVQAALIPYMVQSPSFVPFVQAMCQAILRTAPAMGFAKDNDAWTWLKETFGSLASGLGPIISMLPHPVAKALGAGLTGFGGLSNPTKPKKSDIAKKVTRAAPTPAPSVTPADMVKMAKAMRPPRLPARSAANYNNQRAVLKRDIVLDKRALKNARARRIGPGDAAGSRAARKRRARTRSF